MIKDEEFCSSCGQKMTKLVRIIKENNKKIKTYNYTWICENPKCILFIKKGRIKNWEEI